MAATGYTPIQLYYSTTASAAPVAGNLAAGELAINTNDGKLYYKDSGGSVQTIASKATGSVPGSTTQVIYNNAGALAGSANLTFDGTTLTAAGLSDSGNLTFTGTGNRITGDFSNATTASRVAFQTSTANSNTILSALPSGTGTTGGIDVFNNSDLTNPGRGRVFINTSELRISSEILGTGTYLPMTFYTGGSERMRIDTSGNVGIGTSSPSRVLDVVGTTGITGVLTLGSSGGTANLFALSGTGNFNIRNSNASTNINLDYSTSGNLLIRTHDGSTATERMRIDSSGNVLVGGTAARGTTAGAAHLDLFNGTAPAGTLTNGISLYSSSGDFNFMDSSGNGYKVGFRNVPAVGTKTGSYTLATADVGKYVQVGSGGSITIPTSTFAEGDVVSLMNNTTAGITITCSAPTSYIAGTDSAKTSMTLATRGVATVFFISSTVCVVTGNVS